MAELAPPQCYVLLASGPRLAEPGEVFRGIGATESQLVSVYVYWPAAGQPRWAKVSLPGGEEQADGLRVELLADQPSEEKQHDHP